MMEPLGTASQYRQIRLLLGDLSVRPAWRGLFLCDLAEVGPLEAAHFVGMFLHHRYNDAGLGLSWSLCPRAFLLRYHDLFRVEDPQR